MSQYLFDNGRLSRCVSNGYINVCVFFSYDWMLLMKKLEISRQVGVPPILHSSSQSKSILYADKAKEKKGRLIRLIVVTWWAYAHILQIVHVTNKWLARVSGLANYRHNEERIIDVGILCCCHPHSAGYLITKAFSMSFVNGFDLPSFFC
jgi:hypothetical protein